MSRIYLDSNGFAYYFDFHATFGPAATDILLRCENPKHTLYSSLFGWSEVRVRPFALHEEFKLATIDRFFRSSAVSLLPYTPQAVAIYTTLRSRYRVKPFDALHLACAAHAGVDLFLTNDQRLHTLTIPGIGTIAPLDTTF